MTEPRIYFPVGTEMTPELIATYTPRQMQNRTILDPTDTRFDQHFDWHQYMRVEISDRTLRTHVEAALAQFSTTMEGQHAIRQAFAMQPHRGYTGTDTRVLIHDGPITGFSDATGIMINGPEIYDYEYLGTDGRFYDTSVQGGLFHEILHAADPLSTARNQRAILDSPMAASYNAMAHARLDSILTESMQLDGFTDETLPADVQRIVPKIMEDASTTFFEYPVMRTGGDFMFEHYKEPRRIIYEFARMVPEGKPNQVRPDLGGDHFYNSIVVPQVPAGRRSAPDQTP